MKTFQVIVQNNSRNHTGAFLVQKGIKSNGAWGKFLCFQNAILPSQSRTQLQWQDSLQVVTATPAGQSRYNMTANMNVAINGNNSVTVSFDRNANMLRLNPPMQRPPANMIQIETDSSISPFGNDATAGVGMNGNMVFLLDKIDPNMRYQFSAGDEYYIGADLNIRTGDVVPGNAQLTRIDFPNGVTTMYATLNDNNTWTISANG